jgi:hypothetical protein
VIVGNWLHSRALKSGHRKLTKNPGSINERELFKILTVVGQNAGVLLALKFIPHGVMGILDAL